MRSKIFGAVFIVFALVTLSLGVAKLQEANSAQAATYVHYHDTHVDAEFQLIRKYDYYEIERVHTPYDGVQTQVLFSEENNLLREDQNRLESTFSYDFTRIRYSGRPNSESVVVVLMGDGFTLTQQGTWPNPAPNTFLHHARSVIDSMLGVEGDSRRLGFHPFNLFSDFFTVYAIHTVSSRPWTNESDFNANTNRFKTFAPTSTTITVAGSARQRDDIRDEIRSIARHYVGGSGMNGYVNMIQVVARRTQFGGVAWTSHNLTAPVVGISLTTVHSSWHELFIHEFGHSFGSLADERAGSTNDVVGNERPNMTAYANWDDVRWSHWIGHGNNRASHGTGGTINRHPIGRFLHPRAPEGWIVPSDDHCLMARTSASNPRAFCAVCSTEITRRLAQHIVRETFYGRLANGDIPNIPTVAMPEDATRILPYAFNGNTYLESITIPSRVSSIGAYAFLGVVNLTHIHNYSATPQQINATTFAGTGDYAIDRTRITVKIPDGTYSAFRNAGWTEFRLVYRRNTIVNGQTTTPWHQPTWQSGTNLQHGEIFTNHPSHHGGCRRAYVPFDGNANTHFRLHDNGRGIDVKLNYNLVIQSIEVIARAGNNGGSRNAASITVNAGGNYGGTRQIARDGSRVASTFSVRNVVTNHIGIWASTTNAWMHIYEVRVNARREVPPHTRVWTNMGWETPTSGQGSLERTVICPLGGQYDGNRDEVVPLVNGNPNDPFVLAWGHTSRRDDHFALHLTNRIQISHIEVEMRAESLGASSQVRIGSLLDWSPVAWQTISLNNVRRTHTFDFNDTISSLLRFSWRQQNSKVTIYDIRIFAFEPKAGFDFWDQPTWAGQTNEHGTAIGRHSTGGSWWQFDSQYAARALDGDKGTFLQTTRPEDSRLYTDIRISLNYAINVYRLEIIASGTPLGGSGGSSANMGALDWAWGDATWHHIPLDGVQRTFAFHFDGQATDFVRLAWHQQRSQIQVHQIRISAITN